MPWSSRPGRRGGLDDQRGDLRLDVQQRGRGAQVAHAETAGLAGRPGGGCPSGRGAARCVVPARRRRRPRPGPPATARARRWPAREARRRGRPAAASSVEAHRPGQPHVPFVHRARAGRAPPGRRSARRRRSSGRRPRSRRGGRGSPAPGRRGARAGRRPRRPVGRPAAAAPRGRRGPAGRVSPRPGPGCRSRRRATLDGLWAGRRAAAGSVSWTIACSTVSSRASSPSSARSTDAFTTTRAASCEESCGAGAAEVRARLEQRGQLLVGPAAQLVGERAWGGRGHPANSTGCPPCGLQLLGQPDDVPLRVGDQPEGDPGDRQRRPGRLGRRAGGLLIDAPMSSTPTKNVTRSPSPCSGLIAV